jgi:uncharacterized protein YdeI (YjbR/CyaY-like superfamily)
MTMNPLVDDYLKDGCGRCSLFGTPQCKVHTWTQELKSLRKLLLASPLTEERKWGMPCYTFKNKNVLMLAAFKGYAALSFFKGSLLKDSKKMLIAPGEHSQAVRMFRFTDVNEIKEHADTIKSYIKEAIDLEKKGSKVAFKKSSEHAMPEEFERSLSKVKGLRNAFLALTPGRQRAYLLHFTAAKQSTTREARIEKCIPLILQGKGLNEEYRQQKKK